VRIQFDNSYVLSNATVATSGYALTETGSNYLLLRTGSARAGAISIQLNSIVNPAFVSDTLQGFAVQTQLADNQVVDTGTAAAVTTTKGALSAVTITGVSLGVSAVTNYTFNFTPDHTVPAGGKVLITVDPDYDLTAVQSGNVSGNTGSTVSAAGNVLTVTLGQSLVKNTPVSLVISNIKNPAYVQTTADFALETRTDADALIDQGTGSGVAIQVGALTSVSGTAVNYAAGASTQYTFDFMPAHTVASGGYLKIEFNSEYTVSGSYVISPSAKYSISSKAGNVIVLNALQEILPASSQSIVIGGITNPGREKTGIKFTLTTRTPGNADIDTAQSAAINITTGLLTSGSVTASTYTTYDLATYTFSFTTANALNAGDKVEITFDADYDVSGAVFTFGNDGATLSVSGRTVIITLGTAVAKLEGVSLSVSEIRNPGVQSTDSYSIVTKDPTDVRVDTGTIAGKVITGGSMTAVSVVAGATQPGASTNYTFAFTPDHVIPANGYVKITFDSDYVLDFASVQTAGYAPAVGPGYIFLTNTTGGDLSGARSIVLLNVKNPPSVEEPTDNFYITTMTQNQDTIDTKSAAGITMTPSPITVSSVSTVSAEISALTSYTVRITPIHTIPIGGKVLITFDGDYNLTHIGSGDVLGNSAAASVSGSILTATLGETAPQGAVLTLIVSNVQNPSYVQATDVFSVTTKDASGSKLDAGDIGGISITEGQLAGLSATPVDTTLDAVTNYLFQFTPEHTIPLNGYVRINFDADFDLTGAYSGDSSYSVVSLGSGYILFKALAEKSSAQSLQVLNIKNPPYVQTTDAFSITTQNANQKNIDTGSAAGITTTAGLLIAQSVSPVSVQAGVSTSYTFNFTTVHAVASGGKAEITVDPDYILTSVAAFDVSGVANSTVAVSGNKLIVTLGAAVAAGSPVSLTVNNIKNPAYVQTTSAFTVDTKNTLGGLLDSGSIAGIDITAGSLASVSAVPVSTEIAKSTDYTFVFTGEHDLPSGGYVQVQFDPAYDLNTAIVLTSGYSLVTRGSNYIRLQTSEIRSGLVSIALRNIINPHYVTTTSNFTIITQTASGDTIDMGTCGGVTTTAAALISASAAATLSGVSEQGNYTFVITPQHTVPQNGRIRIAFDNDYTLSEVGANDIACSGGSATVQVSAKTLIITLGYTLAGGTEESMVISKIKNPGFAQTTTNFTIQTRDDQDRTIDQGSASGVAITAGSLTQVSAAAESLVAGYTTNYTFNFTPSHTINANGYVVIDFDPAYNAGSGYVISPLGTFSLLSRSANQMVLNVITPLTAGTAQSVVIGSIVNPGSVKQVTFTISTQNSTQNIVDTAVSPAISTLAAPMTGISVTPSSLTALNTGSYTFGFTTVNSIAVGGTVEITFDADYDLTQAVYTSGLTDGSTPLAASLALSGSKLIVTTNTAIGAQKSVSVVFSGIKNPGVQTVDGFAMLTKDAAGRELDQGTAGGVAITPGALTALSVTADSTEISKNSTYTFGFTVAHTVPVNGYVKLVFDGDYSFANANVLSEGYMIVDKQSDFMLLKRSAQLIGSNTLTLGNIVNPSFVQTTVPFVITTQLPDNKVIDAGTTQSIGITPGVLTQTSAAAVDPLVSAVGVYNFSFKTAHAIETNGKASITFDPDYDLSFVSVGSVDVSGTGTPAVESVNGTTVNIVFSSEIAASTTVSLAVSHIKNPAYVQTTSSFVLQTRTPAGAITDEGAASGIVTTAGALTGITAVSGSSIAGSRTDYTFSFIPSHSVEQNGYLRIDLNPQYDANTSYVMPPATETFEISEKSAQYVVVKAKAALAAGTEYSLRLGNIDNPGRSMDVTFILTTKTSTGATIDTGVSPSLHITPAPMQSATIQADNLIATQTAVYTINFVPINAIEANGRVEITFDPDYVLTGVNSVTGYDAGIAAAGNVLIITLNAQLQAGAACSFVIPNIKNPGAQTTEAYALVTKDSTGTSLDEGSIAGKVIQAGSLSGLSVSAASYKVMGTSETTTYTFNFTCQHSIPVNGYIRLGLDADYSIDNVVNQSPQYLIAAKGADYLLIKTTQERTGDCSIQLSGIRNPGYVQTTDSFTLSTQLPSQQNIDTGTIPGVAVTSGALTGLSVTAANLKIFETSAYTFRFTAEHPIAVGGKVAITLDPDYNLTLVNPSDVSGNTGATVAVNGTILTVTLGEQVFASNEVSLVISNITNPSYVKTSADFGIKTATSDDGLIDQGSAGGLTLEPGILGAVNVSSDNLQVNSQAIYTFTFTPAHEIPGGGYIKIDLDDDYNISGAYLYQLSGYSFQKVLDGAYFILQTESVKPSGVPLVIAIAGIGNPGYSQTTDNFVIDTQSVSQNGIDSGTASGFEIAAGQLSGVSVSAAGNNYTAGEQTSYTVAFTSVNAIGIGGRVTITFDPDYSFSLDGTVLGNTGATASVSGNTVTVTLGTAIAADQAVSLIMGSFKNPGYAQTTDDFSVRIFDSAGYALDSGIASGRQITIGALTGLAANASSFGALNADTKLTFDINATHTIPRDGYLKISLDSDYAVVAPYIKSVTGANLTLLTAAGSQDGYLLFKLNAALTGPMSVEVGGLTNPGYEQTTANFVVTTLYTGEQSIDTGTLSGLSIIPGALAVSSVSCPDNYAGATTEYTIDFTAIHNIPITSKIEIVFDNDYDLTNVTLDSPAGTLTRSANTLSISLSSGVPTSSNLSLKLDNIINPRYSQTTDSLKITVKDLNGNTVDKGERAGIAIVPTQIQFVTPAAGDVYSVGDSKTIKWQVTGGNISRTGSHWLVQLDSSIDFASPVDVHEGAAQVDGDNNMYFVLSMDLSMLSEEVYLKVSCTDASYTDVKATSGKFSIRPAGGFAGFVSPVSEAKWAIGSDNVIEWNTQGAISNNFKIEYLADGIWTTIYEQGVTAGSIVKSEGANWYQDTWTYIWTVPPAANLPDAGVVMKVTNLDNPIVTGATGAFEIVTAFIKITSPAIGVTWVRTETNDITWEGQGDSGTRFSIAYSNDAGATTTELYNGVVARSFIDGKWQYSYSWAVGADVEVTDSAIIIITNLDDTGIADTSALFSVNSSGTLEVLAPVEGAKWVVGAKYAIQWDSQGQALSSSALRITYTADGIAETLITNSTPNSGSKEFTCPLTALNNVKIHVYQINGDVKADSGAFNFVAVPSLQFVSPALDENWVASFNKEIKWSSVGEGVTRKVLIKYSTDGGATYPHTIFDYTVDSYEEKISAVTAGSITTYTFTWAVPVNYSNNVKIKVEDMGVVRFSGGAYVPLSAVSNKFSITAPFAAIAQPSGGEEWIAGTEHNIIWSETGVLGKDIRISYSINGGVTYPYVIFENPTKDNTIYANNITIIGGSLSYTWTVPNTVSSQCRIKIQGLSNNGSGISLADFAIKLPVIAVNTPVTTDVWSIYDTGKLISWTKTGNVSDHLKIEYFKDEVTSKVILEDTNGPSMSYSWDITEDFKDYVSDNGWIKITDLDSGAVFGGNITAVSAPFKLSLPGFTINVPADPLITGSSYTITWQGIGAYSECSNDPANTVRLEYGVGDNPDWILIAASTQNDGSYENWTVPDKHSSEVRFRITNNRWSFIMGSSEAFKIMGSFSITSPSAGAKLFVGQEQMVEWNTVGTINKVNLYYSKNGGTNWNVIASNITNNGFYMWTIPDAVLVDRSPNSGAYFKVEDAADSAVSSKRQYTLSYYKVTWNVIDDDGLVGDLAGLSVYTRDVTNNNEVWEDRTGLSCSESIKSLGVDADDIVLYYYPGHLYQTTWSRDAFLDATVLPSPWTADADGKEVTVKMLTKLVLKARTVYSEVKYETATKTLNIQCWLQEEEKLLTQTAGLEGCLIQIFDENDVEIKSFEYDADDADQSGVFWTKWVNPGLVSTQTYFARFRVQYEGAMHYGGKSFEIGSATQIEAISNNVTSGVAAVTQSLTTKTQEIKDKIDAKVDDMRQKVTSDLAAARTSIEDKVTVIGAQTQAQVAASAAAIERKVKLESSSRIMNEESFIKSGKTLAVKYKTETGLAPKIDVYDPKHNQRIIKEDMTEIPDSDGIYEYKLSFKTAWGVGSFSIVCSEESLGTIDGVDIEVLKADLEDINSAAVVSMSQLSSIDTNQMKSLSASIGVVSSSIEKIVGTMSDLGSMSSQLSELTDGIQKTVFEQLTVASDKMKEIAKQQNVKIDQMIDVSEKGREDIGYLKKKTLEIKATAELTNDILQRTNDKPITKSWLEPGSILMNAVVVNPSSTKSQQAVLKAYLPVESKPEDIINLGDLSVSYDVQENLYYIYKEITLAPGEMVKRQIELRDVWVISEKELTASIDRMDEMLQDLKGSFYYDRAVVIKESIQTRIDQILEAQKKALTALPDVHIGAYRANMKVFNTIKDDLSKVEALLLQAKPAVGLAFNKVFVKTSWWIILSVILFLALLSFGLFIVWHKQAKTAQSEKKAEEPEKSEESEESTEPRKD
jgi:hypothetical protein